MVATNDQICPPVSPAWQVRRDEQQAHDPGQRGVDVRLDDAQWGGCAEEHVARRIARDVEPGPAGTPS